MRVIGCETCNLAELSEDGDPLWRGSGSPDVVYTQDVRSSEALVHT